MLRRIDITIDCNDVVPMAKFWAEALGYEALGKFEQYSLLSAPEGFSRPKVVLQEVSAPKVVKDRIHLDLVESDVDVELDRLVGLGG